MRTMLYLCLLAVLALSVSQAVQFQSVKAARHNSRHQTCEALERLEGTFTSLIRAGEKQAPTLTYYKQHPVELAKVLAADERSIAVLKSSLPAYC